MTDNHKKCISLFAVSQKTEVHEPLDLVFDTRDYCGAKFEIPTPKFCAEFGYRFGSVGSARVADLMGLTGYTRSDS